MELLTNLLPDLPCLDKVLHDLRESAKDSKRAANARHKVNRRARRDRAALDAGNAERLVALMTADTSPVLALADLRARLGLSWSQLGRARLASADALVALGWKYSYANREGFTSREPVYVREAQS
jgi:hypothetical protein